MKAMQVYISLFFIFCAQQSLAQNPAAYIERHKDWAIEAMQKFGIPASIILAVAMHESANGTSKVAIHLHNHFGIRGRNNSTTIRSTYKGYESAKDSYDDFVRYLSGRKQFQGLFEKYNAQDYRSWAYGIMNGGYAGSKAWASTIIQVIRKYELFRYDQDTRQALETSYKAPLPDPVPPSTTYYRVKKGDTLGTIAKKHHTSVHSLQTKNGLPHTRLKIGQQLKI